MECQNVTAHVEEMTVHDTQQISALNAPLGQPAADRGPVDLLAEAMRLKFSVEEIAELKRLYEMSNPVLNTKIPQKAG
jgi:hypothetical protein